MSRALPFVACAALLCGCPAPPPQNPLPTASAETKPPPPPPPAHVEAPAIDPKNVGVPLPADDVCEKNPDGTIKNPIAPGTYKGILRNAKCDQQRFLTMGYLSQKLGIAGQCTFCHAPDPNDPKKAIYATPTERKRIANWMLATFVEGLRRNDGLPMSCDSCHNDGHGKGLVKILHEPRDPGFAQEWMNEVMTAQFVERDGKRLKCKTCHGGMAPAQEGWSGHVILQLEAKSDGSILRLANRIPGPGGAP